MVRSKIERRCEPVTDSFNPCSDRDRDGRSTEHASGAVPNFNRRRLAEVGAGPVQNHPVVVGDQVVGFSDAVVFVKPVNAISWHVLIPGAVSSPVWTQVTRGGIIPRLTIYS